MKLSLKWLHEYVDVNLPVEELARRLIDATAEVESWETIGADWDAEKVTVAEVISVDPHPNADRLRLATVETGSGYQQVVCGAPNIEAGQRVAFGTEGATLIDGHSGKPAVLKLRPIRGVDSAGMVLSEKELGLSDEHEGILVLPGDSPVGAPLGDVLGDTVFDISTSSNRADLLGVLGFAREVATFTRVSLREPSRSFSEPSGPVGDFIDISIEAPDLCRRFTASVIEDVKIGSSPAWMQDRLLKHGMRPLSNVVDITNYVMLETGQPLHAFDYDLVRDQKIVARRAAHGERLTTLDGVDRVLDPEMLVICDGGGPVGIAGIMGGGNSEVSDSTKTVLLEVANFVPGSIRRTSGRLKLRSEASLRFEKGIGPWMAEYAQRRALHLLEQLTGGRIAKGLVDLYPGSAETPAIIVTAERIERVLGIAVPGEEVLRILGDLGFTCDQPASDAFVVTPPPWRPDVEIPDDVIEEIIRIHGYERLPATSLQGGLPEPTPRPLEDLREVLRDLMVGLGYQEIITYSLSDMDSLGRVVPSTDTRRMNPLAVMNPSAAQHTYLRTSLRASLLSAFAGNRRHEETGLRLFEIGVEYLPTEADLPHERPVLAATLGGSREDRWGRATEERLDFFDAKGTAESIFDALGIKASFEPRTEHGLLEGHTALIKVGEETAGVVAQVHPATAGPFDLEEPVFLVELWLEELIAALPERPAYKRLPRYPAVRQDISLVIDESTPAVSVLEIVRSQHSGGIRIMASIFDEYHGAGVPDGKKSLAIALAYQAEDRTLTDSDVARMQQGLLRRLEQVLGATLRGA
ncbi:MAG TPA: phenylalanine--tRNA ligase subunit beta [Dehalococcoidia bacterium]|nr:phenylalanine--tRNA ligase subunit beta [Dehalococcoidia bacterium]